MVRADAARETHVVVAVPCRRCRPYVRGCVESLLAQTHADLTIVVVNDGDPEPPWPALAGPRTRGSSASTRPEPRTLLRRPGRPPGHRRAVPADPGRRRLERSAARRRAARARPPRARRRRGLHDPPPRDRSPAGAGRSVRAGGAARPAVRAPRQPPRALPHGRAAGGWRHVRRLPASATTPSSSTRWPRRAGSPPRGGRSTIGARRGLAHERGGDGRALAPPRCGRGGARGDVRAGVRRLRGVPRRRSRRRRAGGRDPNDRRKS